MLLKPILGMRRTSITLISFLCLLFAVAGCSETSPKPVSESVASPTEASDSKRIASVDVVKAAPQPIGITAGSKGEAIVRLTIQSGYHVNANPPTYPYLKATELEIAPADGVSAGPVTYPSPINRKFPFAEKPLAVYVGEAELKATLNADKSAKQGERSIPAKLRVQACDDQVCYPPGIIDLKIPVNIK